MNVAQIISAKRDGSSLAELDIQQLIGGYASGDVPDYQVAAFAMAVYFQGMSVDETVALTRAMIDSGETLSWPSGRPVIDKHSTGGIGDKVSIPLAPLLACCDVVVPMISGRGLGTTGGTLDKLESIPGFRCDLSADEFRSVVNYCGCCISGTTGNIAPADRKLYALRDVTATVPSIPLITGSILSKKVAEGIDSLILDVKWGSGAFMKTLPDAQKLAASLVTVGNQLGVKTSAVITDMNQPLGRMIGNAVEIDESVDLLKGSAPEDVTMLTVDLAARMLVMAGKSDTLDFARQTIEQQIESGAALNRLEEMVSNQGGDLNAVRKRAPAHEVKGASPGFVSRINSDRLGLAVIEMKGGRKQIGDQLDHSTGIEFLVRPGDEVNEETTIARIFCNDGDTRLATELVLGAVATASDAPEPLPLIVEAIGG